MTRTPLAALLEPFARRDFPSLEKKLFGLTFPNPIGLAAGFDKNAEGVTRLAAARLRLHGARHDHAAPAAGQSASRASFACPPSRA